MGSLMSRHGEKNKRNPGGRKSGTKTGRQGSSRGEGRGAGCGRLTQRGHGEGTPKDGP